MHEVIHGLMHSFQGLTYLIIYHLDLFINYEQKRKEKVARYSKNSVQGKMPHY